MDSPASRLPPTPPDDNGAAASGIPEDLRCKRSDGKQWRCSALSMPDKTVCEKHYIQAKKRAANSAMRASLKKAKRKPYDAAAIGDAEIYLERKPIHDTLPIESIKKHNERPPKGYYSPEALTSSPMKPVYRTPPPTRESLRSRGLGSFSGEYSGRSLNSSVGVGAGLNCHQCRRSDGGRVVWCLSCDRRGFCEDCISRCYPDLPLEEINRVCPVCRGTCTCKACLRGDNLIKVRIREMAGLDKLRYLHSLLSFVVPVLKQIHAEQHYELELEKKVHGNRGDIPRAKLNPDEQMCCDYCKIPILDYHRHCVECLYDLCLTCCRDLRRAYPGRVKVENAETPSLGGKSDGCFIDFRRLYPDWKAHTNGSIPCPPKKAGGCSKSLLVLRRILKVNWVAKLVRNAEEMVNGCKVYESDCSEKCTSCAKQGVSTPEVGGSGDWKLRRCSYRENNKDDFLYYPTSEDIKREGIRHFQKHWVKGEPIVVKHVSDSALASMWDPMMIYRGIQETLDDEVGPDNTIVKAIDCLDQSEVDIEIGEFMKGYFDGLYHEDGQPQMLKLKDWPPVNALEEFLLYQRPEFMSTLPLLEYIHSKWGLLNLAAKLPHNTLQTDSGPKIFVSYGTSEELSTGNSVTNLRISMNDVVHLLMHTSDVKFQGRQQSKIEKVKVGYEDSRAVETIGSVQKVESQTSLDDDGRSHKLEGGVHNNKNEHNLGLNAGGDAIMEARAYDGIEITSEKEKDGSSIPNRYNGKFSGIVRAGAIWDVFRRQDVPKLNKYLSVHWKDFKDVPSSPTNGVVRPVFDQTFFLNTSHKRKLKEEYEVVPWTFEQHVGEAVFVPAGCPFQVRNLQSSVQMGLEFLSPESLGESTRVAQEIRCLPNDHIAKLQMSEVVPIKVGKMTLYSASSAIREIQKIILDSKSGADLGFEDENLTALVSANLERLTRQNHMSGA
ncbi:Growth-regulating factor 1 [Acorus calamus]|uniref:Growth-regulating factor 1 n=1 Tax=Acorus calamus TaxID=4465 RepID=A0AAV9CVM5_ACOCL|nr:Growth-regulating factor 1 [Acorus calamus]